MCLAASRLNTCLRWLAHKASSFSLIGKLASGQIFADLAV
jgi:hypothetical protein